MSTLKLSLPPPRSEEGTGGLLAAGVDTLGSNRGLEVANCPEGGLAHVAGSAFSNQTT